MEVIQAQFYGRLNLLREEVEFSGDAKNLIKKAFLFAYKYASEAKGGTE